MRLPAPTETLTSDYPQESEPGLLVRVLRAKGHPRGGEEIPRQDAPRDVAAGRRARDRKAGLRARVTAGVASEGSDAGAVQGAVHAPAERKRR